MLMLPGDRDSPGLELFPSLNSKITTTCPSNSGVHFLTMVPVFRGNMFIYKPAPAATPYKDKRNNRIVSAFDRI